MPALIPFMTDRFHLSYALAATPLLAATASSSLVQPLFGLWSDRRGALWLIPGGTADACGSRRGRCGDLTGVPARCCCSCSPVASALRRSIPRAPSSPPTRAVGSARAACPTFNSGGNAGYALGAFVTGQLVVWLGLVGGLLAMVPVLLASLGLARVVAHLSGLKPETGVAAYHRGDDRRAAMALLGAVIAMRSVAWFTLLAFVPLWIVSLGHSRQMETGCCS